MPTRELIKRLVEIKEWNKIPKKDKASKKVWVYFRKERKYERAWFIAYQEDVDIKGMCDAYKGNVLLRFPNSAFFKKFKGKDKIYIDPTLMYIKDMKQMVKGWKPAKKEEVKKDKKKLVRKLRSKKKGGKKILMNF